ncbi:restriction endonuclease subunit S [Streptomyces sp. NBC_00347]|uniref:restriction endonuclease subunit S n=1 Tax=Streptomyces sp. NBC_00347 TaxID=2975721 RepID=UPI00224FE15B|nr:restriction endonuclease subunit S [Streptomyces sp. NBC_00347]MCX5127295.1 restriction endonuclease subunit S [Streptomyces sp. NBC_00347]
MTPSTFRTIPVWLLASKIGSGKTPSGGAKTYLESGVTFLRSQNVHFDGLRLDDAAFIDRGTHAEMRGTKVRPDDVLLNITGASLGRVARFPAGLGAANVNQHVCIIRPNGGVDSRFLAYALASQPAQQQISSMQVGGNREGLNFDQVGHLRVPEVSAEEQFRIADFLDVQTARIDRMTDLQRVALDRVAERDAAALDLGIDALYEQVGFLPLRRFVVGVDQGASPQCDAVPAGEDEWGVLKVSALRPEHFEPSANKRLPDDMVPDRRSEVREGDLLITRANTPQLVGSTAVVPRVRRKLLLSDKIFRVRLAQDMDAHYVAAVARGSRVRAACAAASNGASQSMANLRFEEIKDWPIPRASPAQQRAFVQQMERSREAVGQIRTKIDRQLALLSERRQSLITAAVTGQLDVTTAGRAAAV